MKTLEKKLLEVENEIKNLKVCSKVSGSTMNVYTTSIEMILDPDELVDDTAYFKFTPRNWQGQYLLTKLDITPKYGTTTFWNGSLQTVQDPNGTAYIQCTNNLGAPFTIIVRAISTVPGELTQIV